jgi:hypothetical protein
MNLTWLTPEWTDEKEMIALSRAVVRRGQTFLNMFFHSTCLLPGISPWVKNSADVATFLERIDRFLSFAATEGYEFRTFTREDSLSWGQTVPSMGGTPSRVNSSRR